jgi:hypothetical protein
MDYPGQYMRRIKNVSLTIPCVTGPYTGVHCRLTLLKSRTRLDPCLSCPVTECCHERPVAKCGCRHKPDEHYETCVGDPRIVSHYGAREAIATSSGRNDAGLFELNFHDERHLPFECFGAVSRWRVEIPPENNFFDMDTITDVVMHMNYTSREGGDALRDAARAAARKRLPGNGWIFIDIPKDFPDAWELFRRARKNREPEPDITLKITRKLFPFLPHEPALGITKVAVLFETKKCDEPCPDIRGCACAHEDVPGSHLVEVTVDHPDEEREGSEEVEIVCVSTADWPHLYAGVGEVKVEPFDCRRGRHNLVLTFERSAGEVSRAFVFCKYETIERCCETVRCVEAYRPC